MVILLSCLKEIAPTLKGGAAILYVLAKKAVDNQAFFSSSLLTMTWTPL
jgi:hypothetical protein